MSLQPFTSQRPLPIITQYPVAQHFWGGIFGTVLGFSVLHMSALLAGLRSVHYRFPREASSPCVLQPWYTTLLCTSLNCHIGTMSSLFICSVRTWHRGSRVHHPLLHDLGIRTEGAGQTNSAPYNYLKFPDCWFPWLCYLSGVPWGKDGKSVQKVVFWAHLPRRWNSCSFSFFLF